MFDKLKTKIDLIQKSVDSASVKMEINSDDFIKKHAPKLPNLDAKLEQFKSKLANKKKKKQNQKNIFEEVISVVNKFLEAGRRVNDSSRFQSTQRLRQHVIDSVEVTSNSAKQILMDCVKSAFFANGGICGTDRFLTGADMDSVVISPKEIDFLNMFRVPPKSDYGAIMYENPKRTGGNKVQVNTGLYNSFIGLGNATVNTPGDSFEYETPSNKTLFTSTWSASTQTFLINGLTQGPGPGQYGIIKVEDFFNDYYSNIEMPDLNEIVKKAMLLTLKAASVSADKTGVKVGGSATGMENPLDFTPSLDEAINNLERMLNKLFAFCNNQTEQLSGQTPTNLFHENEEPDEFYFDFDDVEGIDIDSEDARRRKVLKFVDCNNYEVPYNTVHIEDFIYLEDKTDQRTWIDGALNKAASDAYEQSNFAIDLPSFQLSINLSFIFNIPKALIMSVISPKMFLPFVIIYKLFTAGAKQLIFDVKTIMKLLKKIFLCTINQLFWKFLREFWKRVKADLKNFLKRIIQKILRDKFRRYYIVIAALIALLKRIIETGINNCADLIGAIGAAIDGALSASGGLNIPNVLLLIADKLPGFSAVKTSMDVNEKMEAMGIPTGDVNGEPNYHLLSHSAAIEGLADNLAKTPFISIPKASGIPVGALMKH
jgi:hypothetical protein